MTADQIWELVQAPDPLDPLFRHLTEGIWTRAAFQEAAQAGRLESYLETNEHTASQFERQVYDIYSDVYRLLENPHPRKQRLENEVFSRDAFTLVVFDALSLREVPALLEVAAANGLSADAGYALSPVPSETTVFAHDHFKASGPSSIPEEIGFLGASFRHVKKRDWVPDFAGSQKRRVIWALYPDNTFNLDHGAISYDTHLVVPVQQILGSILKHSPVFPVVVTSDHGYIWQGGGTSWPVDKEEGAVLARFFKQGRSTDEATADLRIRTDKAWVSGTDGAARGRFAWGGQVQGPIKLYKHEGVSLMECLTPWVVLS